jgi:hypothetical protein
MGEHIESHQNWWRRSGAGVGLAQPIKPGAELLVEDGYLTVPHQRAGGQLRDRRGDVGEAPRVVAAVATHQANTRAVLVGEDAPLIDFLLENPAVTMEGLADQRWSHGRVSRKHWQSVYPAAFPSIQPPTIARDREV